MMTSPELYQAMKLTVFIGGDERYHHHPLYDAVMNVLHSSGIIGATVTKGMMSYGCRRRIHSDLNEITMENLPLVIEAVDEEEKISSAAMLIAEMLGEHGLVEMRRTSIIKGSLPGKKRSES